MKISCGCGGSIIYTNRLKGTIRCPKCGKILVMEGSEPCLKHIGKN